MLLFGPGAGPEQAVWRQAVRQEATTSDKEGAAAVVLIDLRKFYDQNPAGQAQ